jgi:hypothetical protein
VGSLVADDQSGANDEPSSRVSSRGSTTSIRSSAIRARLCKVGLVVRSRDTGMRVVRNPTAHGDTSGGVGMTIIRKCRWMAPGWRALRGASTSIGPSC